MQTGSCEKLFYLLGSELPPVICGLISVSSIERQYFFQSVFLIHQKIISNVYFGVQTASVLYYCFPELCNAHSIIPKLHCNKTEIQYSIHSEREAPCSVLLIDVQYSGV